jgi:hypothetical protein
MSITLSQIQEQLDTKVRQQCALVLEDQEQGAWESAAAKLMSALNTMQAFQEIVSKIIAKTSEEVSVNPVHDENLLNNLEKMLQELSGSEPSVSAQAFLDIIPQRGDILLSYFDSAVKAINLQLEGAACARLILTAPDLTLEAFQEAAHSHHIISYQYQGSSLLHLAVGTKKGEIALWLMQQSMALTTQQDLQGLYPFGLPEVHLLEPEVVKQLLYLTKHRGGEDLNFTRAKPQFAALCAAAIRDRKPQILALCITFAYKQFGEALSKLKIQGVPAITWLCQRPEYFEMLQCFSDSAKLRFWQFYDVRLSIAEPLPEQHSSEIELLTTYKGTQHRYVTPLESAVLHGNCQAIQHLTTLIHPNSSDSIDVRMSKQFQNAPERGTLVFNFLVNRVWQSLTTEGSVSPLSGKLVQDWEMICLLRHNLSHLVPKWLLENNHFRALTYVTESAKDRPGFALKKLFQLITCVYVLRVGHDKKRAEGVTRANEFMAQSIKLTEATNSPNEDIWLPFSNLLAEPKHSSDENSYRNLLIRFILLEHAQHREYFGLNPADFPTEGKPWWNNPAIALAMATIIRMRFKAPLDYAEPHQPLMNTIIACVKTATRAYFFEHCRQQEAELKGFKAAADLWIALGYQAGLKGLLVKLHNFLAIGWSYGEDSFRGHVQAALLADHTIVQSLGLEGKNLSQTNLVNSLKDYGIHYWPKSESEFTRANLGRVFGFLNSLVEKSPASPAGPQPGAPK